MTEQTGATPAPAEPAAPVVAPAEAEKAPVETTTETGVAEQEAPETGEGEEEGKPKRLNRTQRLQRKNSWLAGQNAEMAARIAELEKQGSKGKEDEAPKEADFNGDTFAYLAAKSAHDAKLAVRAEFQTERQQREAREQADRAREATEEYFDLVEDVKQRIPDFDKVVEGYYQAGGRFEPHVREELLNSEKGPQLTYFLSKNPGIAAELNALSPRDAAREIGRLENKVALAQPKRTTQAPKPLDTPQGGAAPARDLAALAKSDNVSAYVEERRRQEAAKRK